ncbi:amidase [Alkalimonas sp. MEB108]|uniref:Amidase n=1 Tax=Alkalimonas cellulosilytica TaxID=3058395 RepID=A0ABU7J943_9GAMM|nr:amidase [Alkalimonas sp. MEB108]MEE2002914.1 amidase [Alkalimonas sp. MEB108]
MKLDTEVLAADFCQQRQWIEAGALSAAELLQWQWQAAGQLNPKLNCFTQLAATAPEPQPHGALAGLALAVKDNIDVAGFATTAGLEVRRHHQPAQNAFVIEQLKAAGCSIIGKLNMHEGALGASNHNSHFGDAHNPHRLGHTPGGSSGGSGSAVAAGLVPIALGTDTMGSVRIPASYCGVFGFKPSRGAVSNRGSVPCGRSMDTIGPLARSARDLSLVYRLMATFDARSPEAIRLPPESTTDNQHIKTLRILVPEALDTLGVDDAILRDFNNNLQLFRELGCTLQSFSFGDYPFAAARRAGLLLCETDMRLEYQQEWQNQQALFSDYLRALLAYPDRKSPLDYSAALLVLEQAVVSARHWFTQGDLILLPTTPQRAFSLADPVPANQADLTSLANQAGLPALSLPMLSDQALPAGMQLIGPVGSDWQLLALAELWQQASGFRYRLPAMVDEIA